MKPSDVLRQAKKIYQANQVIASIYLAIDNEKMAERVSNLYLKAMKMGGRRGIPRLPSLGRQDFDAINYAISLAEEKEVC